MSISCSRLERERIRACAEREGVSMSRFLSDRALGRNPLARVQNLLRLVLSEDERRALPETAHTVDETVQALEGTRAVPGFARIMRALMQSGRSLSIRN